MRGALFWRVFSSPYVSLFRVNRRCTQILIKSHHLLSVMESCELVCMQNLHDPIPIPDNVPVRLGRSQETQITEPRCSRLQVEVQVSLETGKISVTQLGANTTSIDGLDLQRGKTVSMAPESTLFIIKGHYPHKVVFKEKDKGRAASTADGRKQKTSRKRPAEETNGESPGKKRKSSVLDKIDSREGSSDKKLGDNEKPSKIKKLTEFFSGSKTSTSKESSEKNNAESCKSSRHNPDATAEEESRSSSKKKDKDKESKKDRRKSDSVKNEGEVRKSNSVSKNKESKSSSHDMSDEEEERHVKNVSEKLQKLKEKLKTVKVDRDTSAEDSSKSASSKDRKRSTDTASKSKRHKVGKPAQESSWDCTDDEKLYIFTSKGTFASEKIAGFDIDGTVITTQSGRVFPKDMTDWKIMLPDVFGKLKHLIAAEYKIVFFTNQLGVGRGKVKIDDLKNKFEKVVDRLQVPVQIFISTTGGSYRKPATGMWQILRKQRNDGIPINREDSFYVGDAAGRQENWAFKKKKDFSCSDRLFALNVGLRFHTPEEFFQGHKAALFKLPDFDPRNLNADAPLVQGGEEVTSDKQEVVVMVGFQASGKSTFAKTHFVPKGYVYVNQDTLKTWQRCVSECQKALEAGKSVVIDNTNVDAETRARYIQCAKQAGKPCRCFFFDFSISHCRHNERYREITNQEHKPINEQIFNSTKSRFKAPEEREGFSKIVKLNFVPQFKDKIHEKVYRQFLLEK